MSKWRSEIDIGFKSCECECVCVCVCACNYIHVNDVYQEIKELQDFLEQEAALH